MHVYMVLNMICLGLLISVVFYMLALLAIFLQFFLFKMVLVTAGLKLNTACALIQQNGSLRLLFIKLY